MKYKLMHVNVNYISILFFITKDGLHQVKHAAQHGQQQEGSFSTDIVDGANYGGTRGW